MSDATGDAAGKPHHQHQREMDMMYLTADDFRRDYRTIQAVEESDPVDMFDDVKSLTTAELQALLDSFERS